MVVWIIGLSGAGKTTLANEVIRLVREKQPNVVLLDGDAVRAVFGDDLGHSLEDRRLNAQRICNLCKFFDDQGIHVVCAILSLFPETRAWNRRNLRDYCEVFIEAPIEQLMTRDSKGLYGRYQRGEIRNVAGLDLDFPVPESADLIVSNKGTCEELLRHAKSVADRIVGDAT